MPPEEPSPEAVRPVEPPPRDLLVAAGAAAESTQPVEPRPPRAVRRVVHYDSDGEVASVAEVPATRTPVAAMPETDAKDDEENDEDEEAAAVTPERKRRRRRSRRGRRATGDAEPVQTNVSVFMSADDAVPAPDVPCTALLDAQAAAAAPAPAPEPAEAPVAAPAARQDYSALRTVGVDEVAAGDTIAWGDVVVEHARPVLVWHEGVLRQRTADTLTVGPCDGAAAPVDVPVHSVFCLKRVRAAAAEAPAQEQQEQQPAATTKEPRRLSHPKSRGVSGVLSMLRRMSTEPASP